MKTTPGSDVSLEHCTALSCLGETNQNKEAKTSYLAFPWVPRVCSTLGGQLHRSPWVFLSWAGIPRRQGHSTPTSWPKEALLGLLASGEVKIHHNSKILTGGFKLGFKGATPLGFGYVTPTHA
jgi:hypothetical protein